jgi:hypothetical protein
VKLADWNNSTDSRALLRFAAPRIPRQHLGLVLAELATKAWPHWNKLNPDDWRPAWCTASLRAWCMGELSIEELRRANSAAYAARDEAWRKYAAADADAYAAAAAASAAAYAADADAAAYAAAYAAAAAAYAADAAAAAADAAAYAADADASAAAYARWSQRWSEEFTKELARSAVLVRRLIPYPVESSKKWEVMGHNQRIAGGAMLRLDGWVLVDSVAAADFGKDARQAIEFDMAAEGLTQEQIAAASGRAVAA